MGNNQSSEIAILDRLHRAGKSLVTVTVPGNSAATGRKIRDISIPSETFIIAVIRDSLLIAASEDTVVEAGDQLLALIPVAAEQLLRETINQQL